MKFLLLLMCVCSFQFVYAGESGILEDFDSLGGNKVLLDTAKALQPDKKIEFVQGRIVDRIHRLELSPEFEHVFSGGNTYLDTNNFAFSVQYHFNPHWSAGLKYTYNTNELTAEGRDLIAVARQQAQLEDDTDNSTGIEPFIPELNWPKEEYAAVLNWYPIYGKLNVFDKGIVHFDIYSTLAIGKVQLRFNEADLYQLGVGSGFWWSQHLTSRLELRYKTYEAEYYDKTRKVENSVISFSMGYLL